VFGISLPELILVALIGVVLLGPERMPRVARQIGRWSARMRSAATSLTEAITQDEDFAAAREGWNQAKNSVNQALGQVKQTQSSLDTALEPQKLAKIVQDDDISQLSAPPETPAPQTPASPGAETPLPDPQLPPAEKSSSVMMQQLDAIFRANTGQRRVRLQGATLLPGPIARQTTRKRVTLPNPLPSAPHAASALPPSRTSLPHTRSRRLPPPREQTAAMHACPLKPHAPPHATRHVSLACAKLP